MYWLKSITPEVCIFSFTSFIKIKRN